MIQLWSDAFFLIRGLLLIFRKFHHLYLIFELTQIKTSVKMKINKGSFPNKPTCARSGRATAQKSLAGALGIPELMPPVGGEFS